MVEYPVIQKVLCAGLVGCLLLPLGQRIQALPGNELLRDLPLELDAVGTLSGHGFHSLKAQLTLSNH
jgi:hypothetical protein